MIPRLGDGNLRSVAVKSNILVSLENDSPSRGRKPNLEHIQRYIFSDGLENDSPSRGRKLLDGVIGASSIRFRK